MESEYRQTGPQAPRAGGAVIFNESSSRPPIRSEALTCKNWPLILMPGWELLNKMMRIGVHGMRRYIKLERGRIGWGYACEQESLAGKPGRTGTNTAEDG